MGRWKYCPCNPAPPRGHPHAPMQLPPPPLAARLASPQTPPAYPPATQITAPPPPIPSPSAPRPLITHADGLACEGLRVRCVPPRRLRLARQHPQHQHTAVTARGPAADELVDAHLPARQGEQRRRRGEGDQREWRRVSRPAKDSTTQRQRRFLSLSINHECNTPPHTHTHTWSLSWKLVERMDDQPAISDLPPAGGEVCVGFQALLVRRRRWGGDWRWNWRWGVGQG